ncbi:DUF3253 domain-containing protein [Cognatishimia sp. F0-27]|uniref:DUF3253 domain-containing protein n=1 Tax=Cognatishimia sp. F0-27 TaxID=2816855 RepID=UPI00210412A3|nr:DUF3253 domain-containing protein [Cognatishimia sp. F0-27]
MSAVVLVQDEVIARALMQLALARAPDKTFCPSEVARALASDWRPLMHRVRHVASTLPLVATQRGAPVDGANAKGPIRLRLARPGEHEAASEP